MLPALAILAAAVASPLESALEAELARAMSAWEGAPDAPYYVALAVEERETLELAATAGTIASAERARRRHLDVDLRTGSRELDSTHPLRGMSSLREDGRRRVALPVEDEPAFAVRHGIWKELDARYRDARERITVVRANQLVKVEEEIQAPDFSPERPALVARHPAPLDTLSELDQAPWEGTLTLVSARLDDSPHVHSSRAALGLQQVRETFVDTEGSRLVYGSLEGRVQLSVSAVAPDGDRIELNRSHVVRSLEGLPGDEELLAWADDLVGRLVSSLEAPRGQPFRGPVLLEGEAAAVFFHEVLGHRVEGHRQKRDDDGKTFTEYVGRSVLPPFMSVYDDPTTEEMEGQELAGHYLYDDEGTPSRRVDLVKDGVLVGFLMSRSPLPGFPESTGHGRRMTGRAPVARMGNTVVEATATVPRARLKELLREEARRQGLPFGMLVEKIDGGFTLTGRVIPNAFNVRVVTALRVYTDGRPDELVRGVDLVGTPLVAFGTLLAAGDDRGIFNGMCGAESGWVPVSASSPSLLFESLEFQLKEKGEDRPPLLPRPTRSHPSPVEEGGE